MKEKKKETEDGRDIEETTTSLLREKTIRY